MRDGHVIIAVGNDGQFHRLCRALGVEALGEEASFASNALRVVNRAPLIARLTARTLLASRAELLATLEAATVPAGPINTIADVFEDPQVLHRALRSDIASPAAEGGSVPAVRTPILIDGEPMLHPAPAPGVGEHGAAVRADEAWISAASRDRC